MGISLCELYVVRDRLYVVGVGCKRTNRFTKALTNL